MPCRKSASGSSNSWEACYITKLTGNISQQKCCINRGPEPECSANPAEATPMHEPGRRNALKLLSGGFVLASFPWELAQGNATVSGKTVADGTLGLLFDDTMRTRVIWRDQPLTAFDQSEMLLLKGGKTPAFAYGN